MIVGGKMMIRPSVLAIALFAALSATSHAFLLAGKTGAERRVTLAALPTNEGRLYSKSDDDGDYDGSVAAAAAAVDDDDNSNKKNIQYPIMEADDEDIMRPKAHGTSDSPAQKDLLYGMDFETADRICNFNRHYAEYKGYSTNFLNFLQRKYCSDDSSSTTTSKNTDEEVETTTTATTKFYDSVTGNLLFTAPIGRTMIDFLEESKDHGWPSFRDEEVNWEYVRCLQDGECVSTTGTHLGHLLPDAKGNRYCINLVSIAGRPKDEDS